MAKAQPIEHSKRAQKREQRARGEDMSTISTKMAGVFLDKIPFANFIKPEKSDKSCHYEKQESIRDGLTKRLIAEEASRKNAS